MNDSNRWNTSDIVAWHPLGRLFGFHNELVRFLERPLAELAAASQRLTDWNPAVDLYEDKDNVYVKAELPGIKKEDIEVSLRDGTLSLSGERKVEQKPGAVGTHRSERFAGHFHRSVTLPSLVNGENIKAQYKDGILTVTLPKAEEAKPKKIEVKIA